MYCFTDSMRPFVSGPVRRRVDPILLKQGVTLLAHQARWSGAVQFVHAVARTGWRGGVAADRPRKGIVEARGDLVRSRA